MAATAEAKSQFTTDYLLRHSALVKREQNYAENNGKTSFPRGRFFKRVSRCNRYGRQVSDVEMKTDVQQNMSAYAANDVLFGRSVTDNEMAVAPMDLPESLRVFVNTGNRQMDAINRYNLLVGAKALIVGDDA